MKPLENMIVLNFSRYLAGPSAALRLADMGARAIKIERPGNGDGSRQMKLHNLDSIGGNVLFQIINRDKRSFCADLGSPEDINMIKKLIRRSDITIENFRPDVMKKIGLGCETIKSVNPRMMYGTVTGHGATGPWNKKPGQSLLVQSISGLTWLNGDDGQPPMSFTLSLADSCTGIHLAGGAIACLFRRFSTGLGGLVEVSLLESTLDMQFEVITIFLNDGRKPSKRDAFHNAHAYLGTPYGIYRTGDGYIALAMGNISKLGRLIEYPALSSYDNQEEWFTKWDEIKQLVSSHLLHRTTASWLKALNASRYQCSNIYSWDQLLQSKQFHALDMLLNIRRPGGNDIFTARCPISFGDGPMKNGTHMPLLGGHTLEIIEEFHLKEGEEV